MFTGARLTGVKFYHGVEEITYDNYNSETGYITFKMTSFSEYTVLYNADYAKETFDEEGNSTGMFIFSFVFLLQKILYRKNILCLTFFMS